MVGGVDAPAISAGGQYVAFRSESSNLVGGETNGVADIFVYETATGQIERVSFQTDGNQRSYPARLPSISEDGRLVAYQAAGLDLGVGDAVFIYNRSTSETIWASRPPNDQTPSPSMTATDAVISSDGSLILFSTNIALIAEDSNNRFDVYVSDYVTGVSARISLSAAGEELSGASMQPSISADNTRVVFMSTGDVMGNDTNSLPDIYMRTR